MLCPLVLVKDGKPVCRHSFVGPKHTVKLKPNLPCITHKFYSYYANMLYEYFSL
jgi:hypothetical protein